jgi:membrane protein implicated in regulation of membrane protease activity
MKPTKLNFLFALALAAAVAGYLIAAFMVGRGFQVPVSPTNLLITLGAIGVVLLALAIPIWRYRNGLREATTKRPKRVDPFYAVRVLLLAKASSLAGALFAGWHIGVVGYQVLGPVVVPVLALQNGLGFFASFALVTSAYVTEQLCRLPSDPNPDTDQGVTS